MMFSSRLNSRIGNLSMQAIQEENQVDDDDDKRDHSTNGPQQGKLI
jgi:hypothetical protein